jgi:hypothetical protein
MGLSGAPLKGRVKPASACYGWCVLFSELSLHPTLLKNVAH